MTPATPSFVVSGISTMPSVWFESAASRYR